MRTLLLIAFSLTLSAQTSVVTAFHTAVKSGNATGAAQLLAVDAYFMESGGIETRAEYVTNHLPEDIKFEKEVTSAWKSYKVTVQGDVAWATSTEDITGTFEGKPVNLAVVELMVLSRQNGTWKIRSISWSSRRR
ncbi:MAG: nuclear transport factor 2 family protein [Bryobacteraceae bacterium]